MQTICLSQTNPQTFLLIFKPGDECIAALTAWAEQEEILSASFSAIGVFNDCQIGYLNRTRNQYDRYAINESAEVLSLTGTIVHNNGKPDVHAHVSLGMYDSTARGGHLLSAHVYPTLEMTCTTYETPVRRSFDMQTGQELINGATT